MRVQPHLPSRPLTATMIVSEGSAWCACSAANRPAPPEPRIRMSVSSLRTARLRSLAQLVSLDQHVGGQAKACAQPADHLDAEGPDAIEHLGHPGARPDVRLEILARESPRLHDVEQQLDGIPRSDGSMLALISFDRQREHKQ